jgi:hypothetical protein
VRKVFSLILLFIFLLNIIGFYPIFLIKQQLLKKDLRLLMNQTVIHNKTVILTFNLKENRKLKWINNNEFFYEGNLYDVLQQRTEIDGTVYYSCFNDSKEKRLIVQLDEEINRQVENHTKDSHSRKDLTKNLIKEYLQEKSDISFLSVANDVGYSKQVPIYTSLSEEIQSPPPKSV